MIIPVKTPRSHVLEGGFSFLVIFYLWPLVWGLVYGDSVYRGLMDYTAASTDPIPSKPIPSKPTPNNPITHPCAAQISSPVLSVFSHSTRCG